MSERVWKRNEPSSPCVDICVIDRESRLCIGCKRTGEEISVWGRLSEEARRAIMAELPARKIVKTRRGGRAGRQKDA